MKKVILSFIFLAAFFSSDLAAQESVSVYPVQFVTVSKKTNAAFEKALSKGGSGSEPHSYGNEAFLKEFKASFPGAAASIDDSNKYTTFVAYLQIPRVSRYEIQKTERMKDLYLPVTMSLTFANMVTGESLYSYAYTYSTPFRTTSDSATAEEKIVDSYRETYQDLLKEVIGQAKKGFAPFSISAVVKKIWNDDYILDKGTDSGIAKGDTLTDQHRSQLSVIYSSRRYSVAQKLLGEPKNDSVFSKVSNRSIDELKKPKVMLIQNKEDAYVKPGAVPDNMVYQLFIDALGKKAAFSLVSVDRSFYDIQDAVVQNTNLKREVTQNREPPDYFLKLYFRGPFYSKLPTDKTYASVDNYTIMACGDLLDSNGRVLYGTCVDDKITDQVYGTMRFTDEAREEILVKNAVGKMAESLARDVKFQTLRVPVRKTEGNNVIIEDTHNGLVPGQNLTLFKKLDRVAGIDEDIFIPAWQLNVGMKGSGTAVAGRTLALSSKAPEPVAGDSIFVDVVGSGNTNAMKVLQLCQGGGTIEGEYAPAAIEKLIPFLFSQQAKYPFYDTVNFAADVGQYDDPQYGYGFKRKLEPKEVKSDYCVEPAVQISKQAEVHNKNFTTYTFVLVETLKVHKGADVVWKKGLQQGITIVAPIGCEKDVLDFELTQGISNLMSNEIVKKIEVRE